MDDKGEPRKKRAKLNDDGTQKQTRNRRKGNDDAEQTARFWSHFPNARGLLKGRKGARLDWSIGTDGISCSMPLIVPGRPGSTKESKEAKTLENCCDLTPGNPRPITRKPGQRLVAINPGRRDMVYCVTSRRTRRMKRRRHALLRLPDSFAHRSSSASRDGSM